MPGSAGHPGGTGGTGSTGGGQSHDLIRVGLIIKPHGTRGEVLVKPLTNDAGRYRKLESVYAEPAQAPPVGPNRPASARAMGGMLAIEGVRFHNSLLFVKFAGYGDADAALALKGRYISVPRGQLVELAEDEYFVFDLVGCSVFSTAGALLGELADVLETGSNDVYVVRRAGGAPDLLIPALKAYVKEVRIGDKTIVVDYAGLDDEPEPG
ncbi:MAG: ribosome maturation factor RimM [Clostridiales bacterium]|jgi:16S rRNA processing protein RimM|nr:ribosome maturation factor RimM [Clostridiales bacterium]